MPRRIKERQIGLRHSRPVFACAAWCGSNWHWGGGGERVAFQCIACCQGAMEFGGDQPKQISLGHAWCAAIAAHEVHYFASSPQSNVLQSNQICSNVHNSFRLTICFSLDRSRDGSLHPLSALSQYREK